MSASDLTEIAIWKTLRQIIDPELGCNIVDLGMIYGLTMDGSHVHLRMTLTAPGCPMGDILTNAAKSALLAIPGIEEVEVLLVWEPRWSVACLSPAARKQLGVPVEA